MMDGKRCYTSLLDAVGNTPMVRLKWITEGLKSEVYAKLEFVNPMGSSKDRIARYMIEKAEREGRIKPGDTIVESSSGNTALGLALVAIQKGYKLKVIVRDRTSKEKVNSLRALGAEIHFVDSTLPPESPDSYNNVAPRIVKETPNSYFPDQHNNRENNEAHYAATGPEIWEQMDGEIDYFVAGVGTGGTISGVSRYLKERNPKIKVIGVDTVGSVFTHYFYHRERVEPSPYLTEGLGDEFIINCVEWELIDDMYQISDKEAFHHTRELARREGLLVGGSSGAVMAGVLRLAREIDRPARIATLFADGATRYLSTIFNDEWMSEKGML
ncbi:MAG: cysteine synthase family protein [Acidobacteriota bacterium]